MQSYSKGHIYYVLTDGDGWVWPLLCGEDLNKILSMDES